MSQATLSDRPYVNSNLFSGHYLDERIQQREEWDCDDAAAAAFEQLQERWAGESDIVGTYNEDALIDAWIDEVLDALGFGKQPEVTLPDGDGYVDGVLFESDAARQEAANVVLDSADSTDLFERAIGLLEAKQWDADFSIRFNEQRPYRNASHQIKHYLERTPGSVQWGILTNGRKWRLYGTKDYETQTYYEVDLPELLASGDLEEFKYFYAFFRPEAFRETADTTFLDEVWSESETAAQELGEDLQDNVFTALRVLGRGFVETNEDLDIDPDDEAALEQLKEQSLVLLYRLMFVLYAESRGLIHPEDPASEAEYEENFSLDELRLDVHEEIGEAGTGFDDAFSEYSTSMWSRLSDLFSLIDEGEESLGVPPYNGGLFDHDKHAFLAEHEVSDRHLAEVIYRLSTTQNGDGRYVLADYGDLDTRHLGSVYEGLLEHHFKIAPEEYAAVAEDGGQVWKSAEEVTVADAVETVPEGGLYVVNDEGERKATGAYYTPDYVVTYIVEETVGPLVEEIREDLIDDGFEPGTEAFYGPFFDRVTDLKILDPAMGSGHFLTRATEFLAQEVVSEAREIETELGHAFNEQHIRREVAKDCIYGVDLNGMAVELAKLSMWLETLAADRPLAFLDHHLKTGNSLVGSDVTEVLAEDAPDDDGQLTIFQALAKVRQSTLEHVMDLMEDLLAIDNETLDDVQSMEEIYDEIRADPLYQRLFELTNVDTAEQFGLDVPEGAYEEMAGAIEDEDEWAEIREKDWFVSAQALAGDESFFHWQLEHPEVFFGEDGVKRGDAGFDAVIGNPPWVIISNNRQREYLWEEYEYQSGQPDLYRFFIERCIELGNSQYGMITPSSWLTMTAADELRERIIDSHSLETIAQVPDDAFPGVNANMSVFIIELSGVSDVITIERISSTETSRDGHTVSTESIRSQDYRIQIELTGSAVQSILSKVSDSSVELAEIGNSTVGYQLYHRDIHTEEEINDEVFHAQQPRGPEYVPEIRSSSLHEYYIDPDPDGYIDLSAEFFRIPPEKYRSSDRILIREVPGPTGIVSAQTAEELLFPKSVLSLVLAEEFETHYVVTLLNSTLLAFELMATGDKSAQDLFPRISGAALGRLSIHDSPESQYISDKEAISTDISEFIQTNPDPDEDLLEMDIETILVTLGKSIQHHGIEREKLNTALQDHLGNYALGHSLSDIGFSTPPSGLSESAIGQTTEQLQNLRVGRAVVDRTATNVVEIRLTARYKPEDEDAHTTDSWGYSETEPLPALEISDLTETEADLIEHFVPVAVDEAGGFANFRENATKTNSLVDRLRALTLPAVDDVREGLESYIETKERAEELEAKIERTDDLIDEIVYELYGLSEAEIEVVEEAVAE
jgi:type I restriction-modification system DNA methylase subunit